MWVGGLGGKVKDRVWGSPPRINYIFIFKEKPGGREGSRFSGQGGRTAPPKKSRDTTSNLVWGGKESGSDVPGVNPRTETISQ